MSFRGGTTKNLRNNLNFSTSRTLNLSTHFFDILTKKHNILFVTTTTITTKTTTG